MEKLSFKMDVDLTCPHCGYEWDTRAYLNMDEYDCPECDKHVNVTFYCNNFKAVCTK